MRDEDVCVAIRTVFARFAELGRQCRRDRLLAGAESVHGLQNARVAQPRSLTVKRLLQGIPCAWADQRTAFGLAR